MKMRFWYKKKEFFLITVVKFQASSMFHLDIMNKKVGFIFFSTNMWLPCSKLYSCLLDSVMHIFMVSMKTTGAILLKIWNETAWMVGLNVK